VRLEPLGEAAGRTGREEDEQIEDDEDAGEEGKLPSRLRLSLRWCHGLGSP
jgi:hypothetical protein